MSEPLTLDHLTVAPDAYGADRVWDNRDPECPVALDEDQLTELVARVLFWRALPTELGEPT